MVSHTCKERRKKVSHLFVGFMRNFANQLNTCGVACRFYQISGVDNVYVTSFYRGRRRFCNGGDNGRQVVEGVGRLSSAAGRICEVL